MRITTNREKAAISPVPDIIKKAATVPDTTEKKAPSLVKAAIVPDTTGKKVLSLVKAAIVLDITEKEAPSLVREAINLVRVVTIAVHALPITILMPSTA